jgi:glycosyltransferase involved in cell wall biosynthesis
MVIKDYPSVKLVTLPERFGQSYARNIGIKEAHGEYVKFLDSDDVHLPGWLEPLREATGEGYDVITMGCVAGTASPVVYWDRVMYTSQITVKRSALMAVGGFDVSINYEEEHELLKRLDDAAYKAYRLKIVGVVKRSVDEHSFAVPSSENGGDAVLLRKRLCPNQRIAPTAR